MSGCGVRAFFMPAVRGKPEKNKMKHYTKGTNRAVYRERAVWLMEAAYSTENLIWLSSIGKKTELPCTESLQTVG